MRKQKYFFLILGAILIILNCNKKSTDPENKPPKVIFVPSSDPLSEEERGIDAIPEGNGILIEWYSSPDEYVERYDIYRSDNQEKKYILLDGINVPDTSYTDEVPKINVRYYYYVQAVNIDGFKSESSDTVSYQLLTKAEIVSPKKGEILSDTRPLFEWRDPNYEDQYVIRLREAVTDTMIWISRVSSEYNPTQKVTYNHSGNAKVASLTHGLYEWRVDVIGGQGANIGSESGWVTFTIN